jgi:hypothetical protein
MHLTPGREDDAMRLLRTAAGGFINAAKIVRLADQRERAAAVAPVLDDGPEVALAPYYSAPGRIERDLPGLVVATSGDGLVQVPFECRSAACCGEL